MKKILSIVLVIAMILSFAACGKKEGSKGPESALALMEAVWENSKKDLEMPAMGGDFDTMADNKPGKFNTENYKDYALTTIFIPEDVVGGVKDDCATIQHMMNANTFFAAAFKVDSAKASTIADTMKKNIQGNHWMCGMPDTLIIFSVGDYLVVNYGADDIVQIFKKGLSDTFKDGKILVEGPAAVF